MGFDINVFYGYIIKGDLLSAMSYVEGYPEQAERCHRYLSRFVQEQYATYEVDVCLNSILNIYQQYYREVFFLQHDKEMAAENMRVRFVLFFNISDKHIGLDDIEEKQITGAFSSRGFCFQGGKTAGHYGPYVWRTTETVTYAVELPDGTEEYTVKLLDGFISRSWIDYLSFGEIGPGGWTDGDGIINCVRSAYDLESEDFAVSLLKHEAQHAMDLRRVKDMSSGDLEYRAKLVELIYSRERNLLKHFIQHADDTKEHNGHALAATRIMDGFAKKLNRDRTALGTLSIGTIQTVAKALFAESNEEIAVKYGGSDHQGSI